MKKIVLGLILLFVFTSNAWGLTGYEWQKYSNESKTLFIAGFLLGYNSGQIDGRLKILGDVKDTFTASGRKCKLCVEDLNFLMIVLTQMPLEKENKRVSPRQRTKLSRINPAVY